MILKLIVESAFQNLQRQQYLSQTTGRQHRKFKAPMITAVRKVGEYLGGVALIHAALHNTVTLVPCTTYRLASTHVVLNTQLHSLIECTLHNVGLRLSMLRFTTHADEPTPSKPMPCYGCSCVMLYLLVSMLQYSINAVMFLEVGE